MLFRQKHVENEYVDKLPKCLNSEEKHFSNSTYCTKRLGYHFDRPE